MLSKVITASTSAAPTSPAPVPVPNSRRSKQNRRRSKHNRRRSKHNSSQSKHNFRRSKTVDYLLATNRRKAFDPSFAAGMDAAIANVMEVEAAAARVKLPMKRPRKVSDTAFFVPRKKARISSIKESYLTAESSESEPLGSYWTIVPNRRGNMIPVRRSHRLTRS